MDFISTFPLNFLLFFFYEILKQFEMFNLQFIARSLACFVYPREGRTKSLKCVCMLNKRVYTRYRPRVKKDIKCPQVLNQ